jgi:transcription-repair coupling factor (superfamily II helicase)
MLINRIARQLLLDPELTPLIKELEAGHDATLAVPQSARTLTLACLWARSPRPCLFVVASEEAADRAMHAIACWTGLEYVVRYPDRQDLPWQDKPADLAVIGARTRAVSMLAEGKPCIVIASARALLRRVPPASEPYWSSSLLGVGDEIPPAELGELLLSMGYVVEDDVSAPGTFRMHGDTVDIYPAQATAPVRIEFFGDEIDRIRRMVSATGQTIGDLDSVEILPAREYALTEKNVKRAERALWKRSQEDTLVAADVEAMRAGVPTPRTDRYLQALYGKTGTVMDHMSKKTLVCLAEPRSLFDDCLRASGELASAAAEAACSVEGLFTEPRELDFGTQQRLNFSSMLTAAAGSVTAELAAKQPQIAGSDTRLVGKLRGLVADKNAIVFAVPDRSAREALETTLSDEHVPFAESLANDPSNRTPLLDKNARTDGDPLARGIVTFVDAPVPAGVLVPGAKLAVLSVGDMTQRMAKSRKNRRVDVTQITFPFKPGDYVVHATHGVAYFADIVRQEVAGLERDYFLLEYAGGDKLYVPLEQVDRITRYVGPDGSEPRLTRLNTADWSRAVGKARKNVKKLAFDLVDLYTRRAAVTGYAFSPDTSAQLDMEAAFPYELTHDQQTAIADIKADMENPKPMDRLLCGDVGFGKTEVALRAAFKCVQDGRQVMVLCPTTILAQQHYETFEERMAPFGVRVEVLSRFRTPAQQRKALEAFSSGEVDVLIGTHRLLSRDVNPANLGLVIVDEEQRFGVGHKEQLKNMREQIDVLTLSATPIPRTMQMSLSGVRDMSLIMTPPGGRKPVKVVVGEYNLDTVSDAIRREMHRGGQVYYVSNRVNGIEDAVARVAEAAPEARIGVAHGQMSPKQVEEVMMKFAEHEIDVLVATTIIESGIDNPHTNTLIIEDSQRLGLAQLYQLKGRVGRGRQQAYAYFLFPPEQPLTPEATERLMAISEFQELGSGMRIAMRDLEIRGAGSLVGGEQHGNLSNVGFDLFTQMLGEAVAEARGETGDVEPSEITINLGADFYIDDDYLPAIDKKVLYYRRIAAATELAQVDEIEADLEQRFGPVPEPVRNLLDRARIRIRAGRLGVTSVALTNGRLIYQGLETTPAQTRALKAKGALVYPKTRKVAYPFRAGKEDLLPAALGVLEEVGGSDDEDE